MGYKIPTFLATEDSFSYQRNLLKEDVKPRSTSLENSWLPSFTEAVSFVGKDHINSSFSSTDNNFKIQAGIPEILDNIKIESKIDTGFSHKVDEQKNRVDFSIDTRKLTFGDPTTLVISNKIDRADKNNINCDIGIAYTRNFIFEVSYRFKANQASEINKSYYIEQMRSQLISSLQKEGFDESFYNKLKRKFYEETGDRFFNSGEFYKGNIAVSYRQRNNDLFLIHITDKEQGQNMIEENKKADTDTINEIIKTQSTLLKNKAKIDNFFSTSKDTN